MAEPSIHVEKHSEYVAKQCPVCKKGVEEGEVIVLCPRCKSPHHENCWYQQGGCGKIGCRGVASARPTDAQSALAAAARSRGAGTQTEEVRKGGLPQGSIVGIISLLVILGLIWYALR